MSHHRGKYLGYMLKDSIFLSLLQIISKCISTRADRQKQNKAKIHEIRTSDLKVIICSDS